MGLSSQGTLYPTIKSPESPQFKTLALALEQEQLLFLVQARFATSL